MSDRRRSESRVGSLAGVGAAALVVACCAAGPAVVALVGGLGVAALLGVGGAVLAALVFAAGTAIVVRARRRRACRAERRARPRP